MQLSEWAQSCRHNRNPRTGSLDDGDAKSFVASSQSENVGSSKIRVDIRDIPEEHDPALHSQIKDHSFQPSAFRSLAVYEQVRIAKPRERLRKGVEKSGMILLIG